MVQNIILRGLNNNVKNRAKSGVKMRDYKKSGGEGGGVRGNRPLYSFVAGTKL